MSSKQTRSKATKFILSEKFTPEDSFPNRILPTAKDVIQRVLHEKNWHTRTASTRRKATTPVAEDLIKRWVYCTVNPMSSAAVVKKIDGMIVEFAR